MVEEPEQRVHNRIVCRGERDVPDGLVHRHLLSNLPRVVNVRLPRALVLVRSHVIVDRDVALVVVHLLLDNGLPLLPFGDVPGGGQEGINAHVYRDNLCIVVLVHMEDTDETGGDSDQHSGWSVHVVDPSRNRFVGHGQN